MCENTIMSRQPNTKVRLIKTIETSFVFTVCIRTIIDKFVIKWWHIKNSDTETKGVEGNLYSQL